MRILLLILLTVCTCRLSVAQETPFRHGRLDNGLTYYVRATGASAGKADFYLVQNVGALMERRPSKRACPRAGAHGFSRHGEFSGGRARLLKRRGIRDLNAYTGADETVYHINGVPTADRGLVDSCLLILHDWSGFLQLRADEMEIERKVILEERRQGMDLSQRMQSKLNAYLYNHSMMMPLQVNTGTATITKIEAEILENGWSPLDGSPSATSIPGNNQYSLFWAGNGVTDSKAHRYNGFLSLRPTKDIVITAEKPFTMSSNQSYYDSHNRGNVTYEGADVAVSSEDFSIEDALRAGKPHISHGKKEGYNVYDVHIPMWTRAKQLIKQTAYTGNNPYVAYMREAKVKITITLSDGKTLTTGIRTDGEDINEEPISIRQVRRVVNPKVCGEAEVKVLRSMSC